MRRLELELTLVKVNKVCRCGRRWHGHFFREWLGGAKRHTYWFQDNEKPREFVVSWCDGCVEDWERTMDRKRLLAQLQPVDDQLAGDVTDKRRRWLLTLKGRILGDIQRTYLSHESGWDRCSVKIREVSNALEAR